jgi:integrase
VLKARHNKAVHARLLALSTLLPREKGVTAMAVQVLTTRFVEAAKPRHNSTGDAVRAEYPDAACPGLHLIVQPTGTRSWAFRFRRRADRKNVKLTLGKAGDGGLSLAAARHAAAAHRHRLEQVSGAIGVTRVTDVTGESGGGVGDKIETAVAAFLEKHVRRKNRVSTARVTENIFNRIIVPAWRGRTIGSIRRRDIIDLVEDIAASGRGYHSNRTCAVLSKFFAWLVARDALAFSPVTGVERPHKEKIRSRILTDDELRALWLACGHEGASGEAIRLMVLTGARRGEVGEMLRQEVDQDHQLWNLPAERTKNGRPHTIPLSTQAWALLEARPRFADCNFVFSADGKRAVNNWDEVKHRISAKAGITASSWRLHDLRRTAASGMQKLGISVPIIEKALNHKSGTFRGIVSVYQQHDYADEIYVALQKWADYVVEYLVGGRPAKVFPLHIKR